MEKITAVSEDRNELINFFVQEVIQRYFGDTLTDYVLEYALCGDGLYEMSLEIR